LKPEWWGSPLAQGEKYQGRKKTCDERTKITIMMIINTNQGDTYFLIYVTIPSDRNIVQKEPEKKLY
jgi:hypothetical protein